MGSERTRAEGNGGKGFRPRNVTDELTPPIVAQREKTRRPLRRVSVFVAVEGGAREARGPLSTDGSNSMT